MGGDRRVVEALVGAAIAAGLYRLSRTIDNHLLLLPTLMTSTNTTTTNTITLQAQSQPPSQLQPRQQGWQRVEQELGGRRRTLERWLRADVSRQHETFVRLASLHWST